MSAKILEFGPLKMTYEVKCGWEHCEKMVALRTPAMGEVEAFCCPGHAGEVHPEWFRVSVGGDSHA